MTRPLWVRALVVRDCPLPRSISKRYRRYIATGRQRNITKRWKMQRWLRAQPTVCALVLV